MKCPTCNGKGHVHRYLAEIAALPAVPKPQRLPLKTIITLVAKHYGYKEWFITGPGRNWRACEARQVAMKLAYDCRYTQEEIAAAFHKKNVSTVSYSLSKIAANPPDTLETLRAALFGEKEAA